MIRATKIISSSKITNNKNLEAMVSDNVQGDVKDVSTQTIPEATVSVKPISELTEVEIRQHLSNRNNPAYPHLAVIKQIESFVENELPSIEQTRVMLEDDTIAVEHFHYNKNLATEHIQLMLGHKLIERINEKISGSVTFFKNLAIQPNATPKQLKRIVSLAIPRLDHSGCLEVVRSVINNEKCTVGVLKDSVSHHYIAIIGKEEDMEDRMKYFYPHVGKKSKIVDEN
ncbi:MAG TPA: hypothetical protein PK950_01345 [Candidatus Paceibacterota bacterium]|nr:hypothetical protein [Candidatus Paceibacterota bacterium]